MTKITSPIENVNYKRVKDDVLKDHIEYFLSIGDSGLTKVALDICRNAKSFSSLRSKSLEYLYTIYGAEYISSEIIPYANGEFLIEIKNMCKDISAASMCLAMEACYADSNDLNLLAHLISSGSIIGINDYIEMVYKMKRPPENKDNYFEGPTTAIGNINDPKGLQYLERSLIVVLDEEFIDLKWRGLKSNLTAAFANCGKTCPQMAIEIVKKYRPDQNKNENNYILLLLT